MRRKLRNINGIDNNVGDKDKGFTLIEVLVVLGVLALIFGISYVVYVGIIGGSKEKEEKIAMDNLKNAAELFAGEGIHDWVTKYDETTVAGDYMCITISDLINNGYIKESILNDDIYTNKNITRNSYFKITRGVNKSIESIDLLPDVDFNKCMLSDLMFNIGTYDAYTDTIELKIASSNNENAFEGASYKWQLVDSVDKNGECIDDLCTISGLNTDTKYKIQIIAYKDGETLAITETGLQTKKMPVPIISFNGNNLKIVYSDTDIYDKSNVSYSFTSDVDLSVVSSSNYELSKCSDLNNNVSTISKNVCYEIKFLNTSREVDFTYDYSEPTDSIVASIKDKSGNVGKINKNYPDYTVPSCTILVSGTKKGNWYTGDVKLQLNGISIAQYDLTTSTSPSYKSYTGSATATQSSDTTQSGVKWYGYVKSTSGQTATCEVTIYRDSTAPKCSVVATKGSSSGVVPGTNNYSSGSWYSGYVGTKATCSDSSSSCDTSKNTVTVTGASTNVTNSQQATRAINAQGTSYVTWKVYDKVGNSSTCSTLTVKLDRGSPSCSVTKSNTGTTTGVTASFKCSDSYSGVSSCPSSKSGLKSSNSYSFKDNAGNTGTCKVSVSSTTLYRYIQKASKAATCTKSCCGYKTCANKACGVSKYKSCTSCSGCGSSTVSKTETKTINDCRTCSTKPSGSGWKLTGSSGAGNTNACGQYAIKCYWKRTVKTTTCKTCRSSVCGVQSYKSCATSACGNKTCTSSSCCGTTTYCGSSYGSWGGSNTGCSKQSKVVYK